MFGFYLKKSFFDGWDNLFTLIILNLVTMFVGFGLILGYGAIVTMLPENGNNLLAFAMIAVLIFLLLFLYAVSSFSFGEMAVEIANVCGVHVADFFKKIPSVLKDALIYAALGTAVSVISYVCVTWYFSQGTYFCFFLGGIFLWADIFILLSMQWFVPVRSIMHNNFKKCLKKCFILTLDNTLFTLGMALYGLVMLVFSIFFIGFIPSVTGITLAQVEALRLRMYKYDFLEEHPELTGKSRKNIPWEELVYDDREALGVRTLKTFFFPWKDGQNLDK